MDLQALEYTREHYNRHAGQYVDPQEALKAREAGPGAPLKKFHNNIKRLLIQRFASNAPRLLDLCCGRGGDIWKWINAGVQYVKGIDLSEGEIEEARTRLAEALDKRRDSPLRADFEATPDLGIKEWREPEPYDAVTCMFAIHYFFVSEQALKQFLHNVSINLREGGYFIGTVPDGKRVNACIKYSKVYDAPMLRIEAHWQGEPQCFGSPYICAIGDTVTSGDVGSMGSFEYLVYFNALEGVARRYGLRLVTDYRDPQLDRLFEQADRQKGFKHFAPSFPATSDPSLSEASALNVAFVFQKVTEGASGPPGTVQQQQQRQGAAPGPGRPEAAKRGRSPEGEPPAKETAKKPRTESGAAAQPEDGAAGAEGGARAAPGVGDEQLPGAAAAGARPAPQYKQPTARRRAPGPPQQ